MENFLVSSNYTIKLCDFGSATVQIFQPDNSWSANKRSLIEDEIARQTTPMYRAPEMLDLYSNSRIDTQADIWALGCVLYLLCFNKHPFEDGAKLRIINGKYVIPSADRDFVDFHDLIRLTLNTDPSQRPNVNEVMFHLENISKAKSIELSDCLKFLRRTEMLLHQKNSNFGASQQTPASAAATLSSENISSGGGGSHNWMGNAASIFKGNSLIRTIKDASSKVIDSVQSSINRTDMDMNYITSRLLVMSCPMEGIESAAFGNNIDQLKEAIEAKHGKSYKIYNLANRIYRKEKLSQVIDLGANLSNLRAPSITLMCKLSANIVKFLSENAKNVCIVNCNDGRTISAIATCTLLMYCGVVQSADACLNLFNVKRGNFTIMSSQLRFLRDTQRLIASFRRDGGASLGLNANECILSSITLCSVPVFNRLKTGCTPYIEIYQREKKIFTTVQDYEQLK